MVKALGGKGYELYSLRLVSSPATLEIVVDRDQPVSLEDIVGISSLVDSIVDPIDPFDGPYTLDVSSLGAEKPIDPSRLERALGKKCCLHLSHPYKGENELTGTLREIDGESAVLEVIEKGRKKSVSLARKDIDRAHLAV